MHQDILLRKLFTIVLLMLSMLAACVPAESLPINTEPAAVATNPSIPRVAPTGTTASTETPASTPTSPSLIAHIATQGSQSIHMAKLSTDGKYALILQGVKLLLQNIDTGEAQLISTEPGMIVLSASMSGDGSTVAYFAGIEDSVDTPHGDDCTNSDNQECGALYIYDIENGETRRVPFGIPVGGLGGITPTVSLSENGANIAVTAQGSILSGTFLIDSETGNLTKIHSASLAADISSDGRFVAFIGTNEIEIFDLNDGTIEIVLRTDSSNILAFHEGVSAAIDLSSSGEFIAITSEANLTQTVLSPCTLYFGHELPSCRHVYLVERATGHVELISVSDSGIPGNHVSENGLVSSDGRFVLYTSFASNLTDEHPCQDYTGACPQVYLRDRQLGRTFLVSQAMNGELPNGGSFAMHMTDNGRIGVLISEATNLVNLNLQGIKRELFIVRLYSLIGLED